MTERGSERLVPVTDESQLRVGMRVLIRACRDCGRDHRCMLLRRLVGDFVDTATGVIEFCSVWDYAPEFSCCDDGKQFEFVHLADTAAQGRLFRVDDGLGGVQITARPRREVVPCR